MPRMANQTSPLIEQRVVAFALGHPGFGPARIAAELAQPRWGGIQLSTNGVWRVLRCHGLQTQARRYGLVAGYAAPPASERPASPPERHLQVIRPGQLVQLDCFCIGRLSGTKGMVNCPGFNPRAVQSWPCCATAASLIEPPRPHDTMGDHARIDDWSTRPLPGPRPPLLPANQEPTMP
jgi:hypothetical protein